MLAFYIQPRVLASMRKNKLRFYVSELRIKDLKNPRIRYSSLKPHIKYLLKYIITLIEDGD